MPTQNPARLVVGVASSALFDLSASDAFFREHGEDAYRSYQDEHVTDTLPAGVAFPFIKRLLALNEISPQDPLVEVIIMSRNDPTTGLRVMNSVADHDLRISRAFFTRGRSPQPYMRPLGMSLFLSANEDDVVHAVDAGLPAGQVVSRAASEDNDDQMLRVAFDFDGVLGSDESERVFRIDPTTYEHNETVLSHEPLAPGPLQPLLAGLNSIQHFEQQYAAAHRGYEPKLRTAVITARGAPAHERAVRSLTAWGVSVDEAFFLGGLDKSGVLRAFAPHIFFDDQVKNLTDSGDEIAGVHIPYGISNQ